MKSPARLFSRLMTFAVLCSVPSIAQDNLRTELFRDTDKLMAEASSSNAPLLAPRSYDKGARYYKEGEDLYVRGRDIEQIREKLKNASAYFSKSLDETRAADAVFGAVMDARKGADSAGARKSASLLWTKGENLFAKAAGTLEDGDAPGAKRGAEEALSAYREAWIEAMQSDYLSPARALLARADQEGVRDDAPKTLAKAHELARRVEALLKENHYDPDEARRLAQEARYEASHALYLAGVIRAMKKEKGTLEDAFLASEKEFERLSGILGVRSRFDTGLAGPVSEAIASIRERDAKALKDADQLRQAREAAIAKDNEIENLRRQLSAAETRLSASPGADKGSAAPPVPASQPADPFREVSSMFLPEEGSVMRDGEKVVIRLYGLVFPPGKNTIEPEYENLLTKVQDAIKKFPDCTVAVEGHTDSQGSDEANRILSESRAKAVAEYLMANMGVELGVSYHGYGKSRPAASNDTPEGRAKNRRIEVVITPRQ
jgi:outer membrane protein OmpA-like peptidoglycan-associated protein